MKKAININMTIYELVRIHPEITGIMKTLGFKDITNPVMLNTVGKIMTIKKGSEMKKIDIEKVKNKFLEYGFELEGE
jgi:hypothetical protein